MNKRINIPAFKQLAGHVVEGAGKLLMKKSKASQGVESSGESGGRLLVE